VSEAASRLTVKVKLHPKALPAETDAPVVQPWSKTRITLASLMLAGAGVAGYQFLLRPPAPAKPAVVAAPERAALQNTAAVLPSVQPAVQPVAEQAVSTTSAAISAEPEHLVETTPTLAEPVAQPAVSQAEESQTEAVRPEVVSQSGPVADTQDSAPVMQTTAATAQPISTQASFALPAGFSRIVLTDQMNNLQPGKAVGQQIAYPQIKRLYLFTELKDYAGQILRHRWYFGDTLHTEAVLTIEDSPWRTYSENWLLDDQRGSWRVEIVDQTQKVIFEYSFTYQ
jgi:hypothetical protein